MEFWPAYESVNRLSGENEIGAVRRVYYNDLNQQHTQRLEYRDEENRTMVWSIVDISGVENDLGSGMAEYIKVRKSTRELEPDSPFDTTVLWECRYDTSNSALTDIAMDVKNRIIKCMNCMDNNFNAATGKLSVHLKKAKKLRTADLVTSDPYCIIQLNDTNSFEKSKVKKWTKNPKWDEHFVLSVRKKSTKVLFTLWDYDAVGRGGHDYLGSAECDFHELVNGVEKHYVLHVHPKGVLEVSLQIDMDVESDIPLTPHFRKLEEKKLVTSQQKTNLELPGGPLDAGRNISPDLEAFIKAVSKCEIGRELDQRLAQFVTNYFIYHTTLKENLPLPADFHQNKAHYKKEAIKQIQAYLDDDQSNSK